MPAKKIVRLLGFRGMVSDEDSSKIEDISPFTLNMMFSEAGTRLRVRPRYEEQFAVVPSDTSYSSEAIIYIKQQTGIDGNLIVIMDGDPTSRLCLGVGQYISPDATQESTNWIKSDGTLVAWE